MWKKIWLVPFATLFCYHACVAQTDTSRTLNIQTQETQKTMTPEDALQLLKAGNERFVNGKLAPRNAIAEAKMTAEAGQFPFAVVLSCIDSRGPAELIFDQGIGDIFSVRVAGNVLGPDVIGSMEFAAALAGSKLIVIMGHTHCGAVKGACQHVKLGDLTQLVAKIMPAVDTVEAETNNDNCADPQLVNKIAKQNVTNMVDELLQKSPTIKKLVEEKKVGLIGAMHDIHTGKVTFFDPHIQ